MRSRAVRAFMRIFQMCDEDGDGALNSSELRKFHLFAWGQEVSDEELQATRTVRRTLCMLCCKWCTHSKTIWLRM